MDRRAFLGGGLAGGMLAPSSVLAGADTSARGLGLRFLSKDEFAKVPKDGTRGEPAASASVKQFAPPVGDQGAQGSCVGWSVGYGLAGVMMARKGKPRATSPSYIYNRGMLVDSVASGEPTSCKSGMYIETALSFLVGFGVLDQDSFTYDPSQCGRLPTFWQDHEARKQRVISDWNAVPEIDVAKGSLTAGLPALVGLQLRQSFFSHHGQGIYQAGANEPVIGGHAMLVVGYDDAKGAFELMNSWGDGWGNRGFAWVDYATVMRDATVAGELRMYTVAAL